MNSVPETRYAKSGETYIAYQVLGDGPTDLVFVPGFISHLELQMEHPLTSSLFRRFASSYRLIRFDRRGTGLSDRLSGLPTLEERMDDVRAVMDDVGSTRAALFGLSEGGPMCAVFAATYPERTSALVLYASYARGAWSADYPWRSRDEQFEKAMNEVEGTWGRGDSVDLFCPSLAGDEELRRYFGRLERASASPSAARTIMLMSRDIDIRQVLPTIRVPTLVMHRSGDLAINVENSRYLARSIPSSSTSN